MISHRVPWVVLTSSLTLAACQPQAGPLSDDDIATIRALAPAFDEIAVANDVDAIVAMFTEDCVVIGPNAAPIRGRGDFQTMIESGGFEFSEYSTEFLDVYGHGDVAYVWASYSETYSMQGVAEPISDSGNVLAVLRKQPDGSWLFSRWMWNSDRPLPPAEGAHSEGEDHQ